MEIKEIMAQHIRTPALVITALFTVIIIAFMVLQNNSKVEMLVAHLRQDYAEEQKEQLRTQVEQFTLHARYRSAQFYRKVSANLQRHLDTALDIAHTVYQNNKQKTKEEIINLIAANLRGIRFNENCGGYFIYTSQGQIVMMPSERKREGLSAWDEQDANGVYFVRKLIENAQSGKRSILQWSLRTSHAPRESRHKTGVVAYFADCDLVIGATDCVKTLQKQLQEQILEWIWQGYTPHYNHLFIVDGNEGEILVDPSLIMEAPSSCIQKGVLFAMEDSGKLKDSGQFFSSKCDEQETILFAQTLPEWDWIVGAIRKKSASNESYDNRIAIIRQKNRANSLQIILGCLAVMGVVAWMAAYLGNRISQNIYQNIMFDSLTGLPNRNSFLLQIQSEIRHGKTLVVLNLDIDDFSAINERFDRERGDRLLCQIVDRLRRVVNSDSYICRVAGDEFLLYFRKVIPCELGDVDVSGEIAEVKAALQDPFLVGEEKVYITSSIGAVYTGGFRSSANELLRRANIMLFRAKKEGKNSYSYYNSSMEKVLQRDMQVARSLVLALSNDEINVVYQPQIDSVSGKIAAVEALCRWNNEELGFVSPDEFIPIAEKNGFILPLGYYVFRKACRDILRWSSNGEDAIDVSINISPRQLLHSNFIFEIQKIISEVGIAPERITLEITENLLITDVEAVTPVLHNLDMIGFRISLDDFGTGTSSLTHIHHLPIEELKIDRSFVMKMFESSQKKSLIKSILALGKSNRLKIVAEGVETQEHVGWLKNNGCDLLQGYFFSRPISIGELREKYP